MAELIKTRRTKEHIAMFGLGIALTASACSTEVGGEAQPKESYGELEIQHPVDAKSFPGMGGKQEMHLKIGERVVGVCLVFPSWEAAVTETGFMKVAYKNREYYVQTLVKNNEPTFQVSESVLNERYLRCNDSRRL